MTVEYGAYVSQEFQTVLALMSRLHTVICHGPNAGEAHHDTSAKLGSPWLSLISQLYDDQYSDENNEDDEDEDGDNMDDVDYESSANDA